MSLEQKINEELKKAMLNKEKQRLDTLRSIRARIIEYAKSGSEKEMGEEEEIKVLNIEAKKRRDAIDMYEKAGRSDQAESEKFELAVITEFLPQQLSEEEIKVVVKKYIDDASATGMKDLGKVMGPAMKELRGKADGNAIQTIVKQMLTDLEG